MNCVTVHGSYRNGWELDYIPADVRAIAEALAKMLEDLRHPHGERIDFSKVTRNKP